MNYTLSQASSQDRLNRILENAMPSKLRRIGIMTGGGDCPGLNAVIRAVAKAAIGGGLEVVESRMGTWA